MCFLLRTMPKDVVYTGQIIWNYQKVDYAQSKGEDAKKIRCIFCDTSLTEYRSSGALAQTLGRAVFGKVYKRNQILELGYKM